MNIHDLLKFLMSMNVHGADNPEKPAGASPGDTNADGCAKPHPQNQSIKRAMSSQRGRGGRSMATGPMSIPCSCLQLPNIKIP